MNIVYMGSHSILDYDELRLLTSIGHDVFSLTGYIEPATPHEDKRPGVPEAKAHPELKAHVDALNSPDNLGAAKEYLPDPILDWADIIICAAYEWKWLIPQWQHLKGKRVIWRTIGQSNHQIEAFMQPLRADGLEIVRYSPKERNLPNFAGEDSVIRFGKKPEEWQGWTGEEPVVGNVTQHLAQRGDACGYPFWVAATEGLQTLPAGPGSEEIGGTGILPYDEMRAYLRLIRCYLYTGTQPASYTLGLIEAMMTGVPVVSIGPQAFGRGTYLADVFEGHELVNFPVPSDIPLAERINDYPLADDDPKVIADLLRVPLSDHESAGHLGELQRRRAINLFGFDKIAAEWAAYLG